MFYMGGLFNAGQDKGKSYIFGDIRALEYLYK
jgi:hypothetical protein